MTRQSAQAPFFLSHVQRTSGARPASPCMCSVALATDQMIVLIFFPCLSFGPRFFHLRTASLSDRPSSAVSKKMNAVSLCAEHLKDCAQLPIAHSNHFGVYEHFAKEWHNDSHEQRERCSEGVGYAKGKEGRCDESYTDNRNACMSRFLDGRRLGDSKGQRYQGQRWKCALVEHDAEECRCGVDRFDEKEKR